jgi:hypothetical protein
VLSRTMPHQARLRDTRATGQTFNTAEHFDIRLSAIT